MITQKPESAPLGKHGRVVVDGTVFESKDQMARDTISFRYLSHLAIREAIPIKRTHNKKAMHQAFHVVDGDLIGS
jgi:hypothetical protein